MIETITDRIEYLEAMVEKLQRPYVKAWKRLQELCADKEELDKVLLRPGDEGYGKRRDKLISIQDEIKRLESKLEEVEDGGE